MTALAAASLAATALAQGSAPISAPAPATAPSPTPAPAPSPSATATPVPAQPTDAGEAEQPPAALAGNWDLRIDGTTIFRFIIQRTAGGEWQGRWQRPDSFNSNGNAFANLRGGVKSTASMTALAVGPMVELAFDDPRPGAVPDIFRFRLIGPDAVAMGYVGTQLPPYLLVRAGADDPLGNWDSTRVYRRPVPGARPAGGEPMPDPAVPEPAAPVRTPTPPPVIQPMPDGRIILGPQLRFLDLTPRQATEEGEPVEAAEPAEAPQGTAPGSPPAPAAATPSAPPAPGPVPAPASSQPAIAEDFLEGL